MKRRDFIKNSAGLVGAVLPASIWAQSKPCPPPSVSVQGGSAAQTSCSANAEADWLARSTAAGVLWATRFATDAEVTGDLTKTFNSGPYYDPTQFMKNYTYLPDGSQATPGNTNPRIYRVVSGGIANGPFMRKEHYASDLKNAGGWRRMFVDGQTQWPVGTDLYVSYALRVPGAALLLNSSNGWKVSILAGWGNTGWGQTCQGAELTQENVYLRNFVYHYTSCSPPLQTLNFPQSGDIQHQNMRDRGATYTNKYDRYCLYNQWNTGSCVKYVADQWLAMKYKIRRASTSTVDIDIWSASQGATQWTWLEHYPSYSTWGSDQFNTLTLTSYSSTRTTQDAAFYHDFTDVIVSTQDIACRQTWS